MDELGGRVAVHGSADQGFEDKHVERALEEVAGIGFVSHKSFMGRLCAGGRWNPRGDFSYELSALSCELNGLAACGEWLKAESEVQILRRAFGMSEGPPFRMGQAQSSQLKAHS